MVWSAASIFSGCHSFDHDLREKNVSDLVGRPAQYDRQVQNVQGVLALTSEGLFLFSNCSEKQRTDIKVAIAIPKLPEKEYSVFDVVNAEVVVRGVFIAKDEGKINTRHRLVQIDKVKKKYGPLCKRSDE